MRAVATTQQAQDTFVRPQDMEPGVLYVDRDGDVLLALRSYVAGETRALRLTVTGQIGVSRDVGTITADSTYAPYRLFTGTISLTNQPTGG